MNNEDKPSGLSPDFEAALIAFFLFGGLALVAVASFALIGFWGSVLWIGALMTLVGIHAL